MAILNTFQININCLLLLWRCIFFSIHFLPCKLPYISLPCKLPKNVFLYLSPFLQMDTMTWISYLQWCACGWGFPGCTSDKEPTCQCRRLGFYFGGTGRIPWRRAWQPTPAFLPGEFHGQGAWGAIVHGVTKSQTHLKRLSMQHAHTCVQ